MCRDRANPQFLESPAHLTEGALTAELFGERERRALPHLEDAVAIGVDGAREAVATEELAEEEEVAVRVFLAPKARLPCARAARPCWRRRAKSRRRCRSERPRSWAAAPA